MRNMYQILFEATKLKCAALISALTMKPATAKRANVYGRK